MLRLFAIPLCVFLTACASKPVNLFSGSEKPDNEVAILAVGGVGSMVSTNWGATVKKVDGKSFDDFFTRGQVSTLRLLPGKHTVTASYRLSGAQEKGKLFTPEDVEMVFIAEAGHTYILDQEYGNDAVKLSIKDYGLGFDKKCIPGNRLDQKFLTECFPQVKVLF